MLLDWHSPLKGISAKRKTSDQSTPHMPIRCLAASPGAITLNVLIIATVVVPPSRLLQMPPFTSALYDEVFTDFAMSNLGVSIAANVSNQTKPEGK